MDFNMGLLRGCLRLGDVVAELLQQVKDGGGPGYVGLVGVGLFPEKRAAVGGVDAQAREDDSGGADEDAVEVWPGEDEDEAGWSVSAMMCLPRAMRVS